MDVGESSLCTLSRPFPFLLAPWTPVPLSAWSWPAAHPRDGHLRRAGCPRAPLALWRQKPLGYEARGSGLGEPAFSQFPKLFHVPVQETCLVFSVWREGRWVCL